MPDRYGFNHLGDQVRCIDCPAGGPIGGWPEHLRVQHARSHGRTTGASDLRRQRLLLAVSPPTRNEEKEATMPTTTTTTGKATSAKQVALDVLREAGEPLHAGEIAKRVLASGRCAGLKGKTPEATISAMLAVGSKPDGPFARVDKGTYTLAEAAAAATPRATGESAPPEQATARKTAAAKTNRNAKARTRRSKHAR